MSFGAALADRIELGEKRERWYDDPVAWVRERLGEDLWSKQVEIMNAVAEHPQVAVQSGHGIGKSFVASRLVAWFLETRPRGKTFVVTTAPTQTQVEVVLWRYIGQVHDKADLPGRITYGNVPMWKLGSEIIALGRKPSDYNESSFQGIHAEHLLVILDEACGIPEQLWNGAHALATSSDSHLLAIGNPDSNASHFYKVCTKETGWRHMQISSLDSPNFTGEPVSETMRNTLVDQTWLDRAKARWGETSSIYKAKALGEWVDDEDGLIPMAWVHDAFARWTAWNEQFDGIHEPKGRQVFGVDVAFSGEDKTVICTRQGDVVLEFESWPKTDTVEIFNLVKARLEATVQGVACVDGIGGGEGVVHLLQHHGYNVRPFIASKSVGKTPNSTGGQTFLNARSAAWWFLRERLNPAMGARLALPPNDDLMADLTIPKWVSMPGAKIKVESKEEIRKRLGRSTDFGDALVQSMWVDRPVLDERPNERRTRSRPRAYANTGGSWA